MNQNISSGGINNNSMSNINKANEVSQPQEKHTISYPALFWLFMFGSVIGFVLEGLLVLIRIGVWENHSATVWGPFCIIYGFGADAMYLGCTLMRNKNIPLQFFFSAVAGTVVEFFGSLIQEAVFHSRSWDYSEYPGNIGGRVTPHMTLAWGILGLLFVRLVYPLIERVYPKMRGRAWNIACAVLSVYMAVNLIVSGIAVFRWGQRQSGATATNRVEEIIDTQFNDEYMQSVYCNLNFSG